MSSLYRLLHFFSTTTYHSHVEYIVLQWASKDNFWLSICTQSIVYCCCNFSRFCLCTFKAVLKNVRTLVQNNICRAVFKILSLLNQPILLGMIPRWDCMKHQNVPDGSVISDLSVLSLFCRFLAKLKYFRLDMWTKASSG